MLFCGGKRYIGYNERKREVRERRKREGKERGREGGRERVREANVPLMDKEMLL